LKSVSGVSPAGCGKGGLLTEKTEKTKKIIIYLPRAGPVLIGNMTQSPGAALLENMEEEILTFL